MTQAPLKKSVSWLGIWICTLGSTFYIYDFFVRIAPSVMTQELMRDLNTFAPGLGAISSALFLTYTFMQIPAGLLIDHYGVRKPLSLAALACGVATFGFAFAHSALFAGLMFGIVGITAGFAFLSALVLGSRWFSAKYFALIVGLVQFMGCVGGIFAQGPLHLAVMHYGWRQTMGGTATVGLVLALLYYLFLKESPIVSVVDLEPQDPVLEKHYSFLHELHLVWQHLLLVLNHRENWWLAAFILCLWTPISIFTSLWGVQALVAMYDMLPQQAALIVSATWVGVALTGPAWGWWSAWIGRRKLPAMLACFIGMITTGLLILLPQASAWQIALLLFFFGMASGCLSMSYALTRDNNSDDVVGTALGFNNMACILGTPIFQPIVSWLLQHNWAGNIVDGVPIYTGHNFRVALTSVPLLYLAAFLIITFCIKETYCRAVFTEKDISLNAVSH